MDVVVLLGNKKRIRLASAAARTLVTFTPMLIAGCGTPQDDNQFKTMQVELEVPSPDSKWIASSGAISIAGGFGTGSYVKAVYLQRWSTSTRPFEVFELAEDEQGTAMKLNPEWQSSRHLIVHYRGANINWQVVKLSGLTIDAVADL